MNNQAYLEDLLHNDPRGSVIMQLLINAFNSTLPNFINPLILPVRIDYALVWNETVPGMLKDELNNEHHIVHALVHDLVNIQYEKKISS